MTATPGTEFHATTRPHELRRVAFATVIGTTIEWYDFLLYASAAGLVFGALFFAPAGPQFATILSFATVGISFLFRPLGAFLAGHFGDKIGRKAMLVVTLILMGAATTLIGVLPTYEQIGIAAPALLILLRILQGLSTGGEWGGAAQVRRSLEAVSPSRIAHGARAADDPALMADLVARRVTLDVCPTSNVQASIFPSLADFPLRTLLDAGVPLTLSTDDRTVLLLDPSLIVLLIWP